MKYKKNFYREYLTIFKFLVRLLFLEGGGGRLVVKLVAAKVIRQYMSTLFIRQVFEEISHHINEIGLY